MDARLTEIRIRPQPRYVPIVNAGEHTVTIRASVLDGDRDVVLDPGESVLVLRPAWLMVPEAND
jgi:hypothetical protein